MSSCIRYFWQCQYPSCVSPVTLRSDPKRLISRVVDCFYSGHEAHWLFDVTGANTIISRAFNDTRWCLDSGESEENGQPVYLNKVSVSGLCSSESDCLVRGYCL
jgi:hypothetical protein